MAGLSRTGGVLVTQQQIGEEQMAEVKSYFVVDSDGIRLGPYTDLDEAVDAGCAGEYAGRINSEWSIEE